MLLSRQVDLPHRLFPSILLLIHVMTLVSLLWSIVVSYKAVTIITDVYRREANLWFIVVPLVFYAAMFALMWLGYLLRN